MKKKIILVVDVLLSIGIAKAHNIKTGITLLQYQRYNSAIENFKAVLQQNPDDAVAAFWLTESYLKNKEADKAAAYLSIKPASFATNQLIKISTALLLVAQNKKGQAGKII